MLRRRLPLIIVRLHSGEPSENTVIPDLIRNLKTFNALRHEILNLVQDDGNNYSEVSITFQQSLYNQCNK